MLKFDDEIEFILGRPNFWCGPVARRLREQGHNIKEKSEVEQAHVLYWMMSLYEQHGKEWAKKFNEFISKAD